jgi:hypothetical protein
VLILYGWIIDVPYLYKISAPINFLLPPIVYLYVRAILFNKEKLNTFDYLHIIPFILVIVNYLPFYLLPISDKKEIVQELLRDINTSYKNQVGYLSEYVFNIFRIFQNLIYLILQWKLIITFNKKNKNNAVEKQINNVIKWLRIFTSLSTISLIAFMLLAIIAIVYNNIYADGFIYHLPDYILASCFFIISTYLLTNPSILAGLPFIKYKETASNLVLNKTDSIPYIEQDYSTDVDRPTSDRERQAKSLFGDKYGAYIPNDVIRYIRKNPSQFFKRLYQMYGDKAYEYLDNAKNKGGI